MSKGKRERLKKVVQEAEELLDTVKDPPLFFCVPRSKRLSKDACYEAFTNVHAYEATKSPCWNCRQGSVNRLSYVWEDEEDIPPEMIDYMLPGGERTLPFSVVMAFITGDQEAIRSWRRLQRFSKRRSR